MDDFYIMQKKVDKSVLCQGMTIPQVFHEVFYQKIGFRLGHGESSRVEVSLNGAEYEVRVSNLGFDRQKYSTHQDILQLRYDSNHELIQALRAAFANTWGYLLEYKAANSSFRGFQPQQGQEEYLAIYAVNGSMLFECIPYTEYNDGVREIKTMEEIAFETQRDDGAYVEERIGVRKIRHLSRSIGNSLKELYGYRCQICGEFIGEKYGSKLIHAHHIEYFTKSLNNNPENILIVCPNHHGIIHDCNPVFDRTEKAFRYPNGLVEGLVLNRHII